MRLARAEVRRAVKPIRHYRLERQPDGSLDMEEVGPIAALVIDTDECDGSFHLLYLSREGERLADTWHPSEEDAKESAREQYGIEDPDWQAAGDEDWPDLEE